MLTASAIKNVLKCLDENCPNPRTALRHKDPFELLIATILSAQCTDRQVNRVTPILFRNLPNPKAFIDAGEQKVESYIKTCGLYKSKAKNIVACCRRLIKEHESRVPESIPELQKLPGVGRKTANVVASQAFKVSAIAVDTHVFRVSNRIGLAKAKTPLRTEEQLMKIIPKKNWSRAHLWIIHHGRTICHARKPKCEECAVKEWCEFIHNFPQSKP